MSIEIIGKQLRAARLDRNLKQKDLADFLDRTDGAISQLEQGKIQISAVDLYLLSQYLNKPIEYFYGEELGGDDMEDVMAILRRQTPEGREQSLALVASIFKMQNLGDELDKIPEEEDVPLEFYKKFFANFFPLSDTINAMTEQLNELRDLLIQEMKEKGIDISDIMQ